MYNNKCHIYINNNKGSRVVRARGFMALWGALIMVAAASARPAAAAPFAYVADSGANAVSVIDTASNVVVATVAVGNEPIMVAVTPDGKHVYVTNESGTVSVIDTTTNPPTVVATVTIPNSSGSSPFPE